MEFKRLDSEAGIAALSRVLGEDAIRKHGRAGILSAYMESWSHPWLAAHAAKMGWADCHPENLNLHVLTGHFDHEPYALHSCSGVAIAVPFEAEDGPVYFVKWFPWVTGIHIMGQVERILTELLQNKHTWTPSWSAGVKQACEAVRCGIGSLEDALRGPLHRDKALQEGLEALNALTGDLGKAMQAWEKWTQLDRERIAEQLARVATLAELFKGRVMVAA